MTKAWKTELQTHTKMVLLALCDNASDSGECYPSISSVAKRCSMSAQGVRNQVASLIEKGYIEKRERTGRSNMFFITDPSMWCTPTPDVPLHPTTPTPTPHERGGLHPVGRGATRGVPITITQPSQNRQGTTNSAREEDWRPDTVDEIVWAEFVKMRKRMKAPLDAYSSGLIAKKLASFPDDPNDVLNQTIENGWRGVFPLKKAPEKNAQPMPSSVDGGNQVLEDARRLFEQQLQQGAFT